MVPAGKFELLVRQLRNSGDLSGGDGYAALVESVQGMSWRKPNGSIPQELIAENYQRLVFVVSRGLRQKNVNASEEEVLLVFNATQARMHSISDTRLFALRRPALGADAKGTAYVRSVTAASQFLALPTWARGSNGEDVSQSLAGLPSVAISTGGSAWDIQMMADAHGEALTAAIAHSVSKHYRIQVSLLFIQT